MINKQTYEKLLRFHYQEKSNNNSDSLKSSPDFNALRRKRLEYKKKMNDTSLFAELVRDKHKRKKDLEVSNAKNNNTQN